MRITTKKDFIVRYITKHTGKISIFLVLCLAVFGAFSVLRKESNPDISEADAEFLLDYGIQVTGTQADDSGLSTILNNVEGAPPLGASGTSSSIPAGIAGTGSTAPPSFLAGHEQSSAPSFAPAFGEAAQYVAAEVDHNSGQPGVNVLPPPSFTAPDETPTPVELPNTAPTFDAFPFEGAPPFGGAPTWESTLSELATWNGPAADFFLDNARSQERIESVTPVRDSGASTPGSFNVRRIVADSQNLAPQNTFSSSNSIPLVSAQFAPTGVREPSMYNPPKKELVRQGPVVAFATSSEPGTAINESGVLTPVNSGMNVSGPFDVAPPDSLPGVSDAMQRFIQTLRQQADSGEPEKVRNAFIQLSQLYEQRQLNETERNIVLPMLDALAYKVIYAKDIHILESAYQVKPNDTIESIAKHFYLTPELLRNINGLEPARQVSPGMFLKVVYGQFDARISLSRRELTLLLGGLYAGRFPFTLPGDAAPDASSGEFLVQHKRNQMITLNNGWTLTSANFVPTNTSVGMMVFADHHARAVFDVLSEMSVIVFE